MPEDQHPITKAVREVDRLLSRTAAEPVYNARDQSFRLDDEEQLLAAVGATIATLERLTRGLTGHVPSWSSRGALDTASKRLADALAAVEEGRAHHTP